eukprot:scaffold75950_cov56-Phaeocystis_antarctica.AAC.2
MSEDWNFSTVRRAERALQHIGRCTNELAAHHRPKVARGARSRPGRTTPASLCTQLLLYKMPPIPLNYLKSSLRGLRKKLHRNEVHTPPEHPRPRPTTRRPV